MHIFKKTITIILVIIMIIGIIPAQVFASEYRNSTGSASSDFISGDNIQGNDITQGKQSEIQNPYVNNTATEIASTETVDVYASAMPSFSVKIPKTIILSSAGAGNFTVGVKGDVSGAQIIDVSPENSIFNMSEVYPGTATAIGSKDDIPAHISIDDTDWTYKTDLEAATINNFAYHDGSINATDISAGSWRGALNFKISVGLEVFTNYSTEEIAADEHLYGIGATSPEYVVAKFNNDYTHVDITKNTENSDGLMANWVTSSVPVELPMTTHKATLETATVYDGVQNIGNAAFRGDTVLESVSLPLSLTNIGNNSFRQTALQSVDIPSNVTNIGNYAFRDCTNLTEFSLGNSIQKLGVGAFYYDTALTGGLNIPDSVETISNFAFIGCTGFNGPLNIGNSVKYIGNFAFCSNDTGVSMNFTAINLGNSIEYIGTAAFQYCNKATNIIKLPNTLKSIGDFAFNHMEKITNTTLEIPASVIHIGGTSYSTFNNTVNENNFMDMTYLDIGSHTFYAFACATLKEFEVAEDSTTFTAIDGVLFSSDETRLMSYPTSKTGSTFDIPEGVTKIDELAFGQNYLYSTNHLKKITLPNSYIITRKENQPQNFINYHNSLVNSIYQYSGIEEVAVRSGNTRYKTIDGCLYSTDGTTCYYIPSYKRNVNIAEGCTKIEGAYMAPTGRILHGESNVFTLHIPASLTKIMTYVEASDTNAANENFIANVNSMVDINDTYINYTITVDSGNTTYYVDEDGHLAAYSGTGLTSTQVWY